MKDEAIMKYVPKRLINAVKEAYHDSDGYWIYLANGYEDTHMNSHVIHGYTIHELREDLRNVERIDEKMSDNILAGCSYRTNKADMIKELAKYRQTLNTSPKMVITSPTEESVRYYVKKCNIKDFDMNYATYGLYSNVKIEYNTETGECKILIFNGRTGEIIASYEGVNNDE